MTNYLSQLKSLLSGPRKTERVAIAAACSIYWVSQFLVTFVFNDNVLWWWYVRNVAWAAIIFSLSFLSWSAAKQLDTPWKLAALTLIAAAGWNLFIELIDIPNEENETFTGFHIDAVYFIFLIVFPIIPIWKAIEWSILDSKNQPKR